MRASTSRPRTSMCPRCTPSNVPTVTTVRADVGRKGPTRFSASASTTSRLPDVAPGATATARARRRRRGAPRARRRRVGGEPSFRARRAGRLPGPAVRSGMSPKASRQRQIGWTSPALERRSSVTADSTPKAPTARTPQRGEVRRAIRQAAEIPGERADVGAAAAADAGRRVAPVPRSRCATRAPTTRTGASVDASPAAREGVSARSPPTCFAEYAGGTCSISPVSARDAHRRMAAASGTGAVATTRLWRRRYPSRCRNRIVAS